MKADEFFDKNRSVQLKMGEFCKELTDHVKDLIGTDKRIVLFEPVKAYGDYVEITELACSDYFGTPMVLAKCANGWCDKPIQPYYANYERWVNIGCQLFSSRRPATIVGDNPLKGEKLIITC